MSTKAFIKTVQREIDWKKSLKEEIFHGLECGDIKLIVKMLTEHPYLCNEIVDEEVRQLNSLSFNLDFILLYCRTV
jgi:hypothetical protein